MCFISNRLEPFFSKLTDEERQVAGFQQDGATAHTARVSTVVLGVQNVFDTHIISCLWPPQSPDLTPDFFL